MALGEQALASTYVAFDTRSGRILSVHHGAMDAEHAQQGAQYHRERDAKFTDEHVALISVPSNSIEPGKLYKVDVTRKALVATDGNDGVGFGFGVTGRSS